MPAPAGVWGANVWGPDVWGANVWGTAVIVPPVALFSVSGTLLTRTFDSSASFDVVAIASRAWNFGDGTIGGNIVAPSHTYALGATYTVSLTVTNTLGVSTTFATQVTVAAAVVATPTVVTVVTPAENDVSVVRICNMALAHCGNSKLIESIDDRTAEARACKLFYAQVRDEVLRGFRWPFAQRRDVLGLIATTPTDDWGYSYRYPADALAVYRMPPGVVRTETIGTRTVYGVASDAVGRVLYTDAPDAVMEYTVRITDPALYPPDFVQALALRLGAMIAPMVVSDGATAIRDHLIGLYQYQLGAARTASANESAPDVLPESEFVSVRG